MDILRVRALLVEADDGEVAVELLKKEMSETGGSFDFVLMDNIMVQQLYIYMYVCMNALLVQLLY